MKHRTIGGWCAVLSLGCVASSPPGRETGGDACRREPRGGVVVSIDGALEPRYTRTFAGVIESVEPGNGARPSRLAVRLEGTGERIGVLYARPDGGAPLAAGRRYEITVERVAGSPGASAILVSDEKGLVLAAAADQAPGATVLRHGLPGFTLELLPPDCAARLAGTCYEAVVNRPLRITGAGASVVLMQGESANLGGYRVECFIAQKVTYRKGCADAGLVALSYRLSRNPS